MIPALREEAEVLEDLVAILLRQRTAVARSDVEGVRRETERLEALMGRVDGLRRRRNELLEAIGVAGPDRLDELDGRFADPTAYRDARERMSRAAREAARQVTVNGTVLRRALETGHAYLQTLIATVDGEAASYAPAPKQRPRRSPIIVNKVA